MSWKSIFMIALTVFSFVAVAGEGTADEPRKPWTASRLHGTPRPPAPYKIVPAFPALHFENPSCIEEMPAANRLFVTEIGGKAFSFSKHKQTHQADLAIDLGEASGGPVSLLDAEFHPEFVDNRHLFLCYTHAHGGGGTRVSRFTMTETTPPRISAESEEIIITWPKGGHNGGCLEFGKDGYLYISTGDGSGPNPPDGRTTGQDVSDLLGAILRIDIDHVEGGRAYAVPKDNPFVELDGARPEIWAYGLRNPWKFGVDGLTGNVYAADNGWETWEMVHRIVRGGNCGWPVMEARAVLRSEVPVGPTPIIPPIKDHSHTEANSVIGGPVYRGSKLPELAGSFIYGDYITGTIWAVRSDDSADDVSYSHQTLVDTDQRITSFTEGSAGELYVLDYDFTGQIYELERSGLADTSEDFPRRLSETGLFTSVDDLQPAAGVIPYSVTVPRWMDGATARRWVAIPGEASITFAADPKQRPRYPNGTVLIKHLDLPAHGTASPIRLETQLLHFENGVWNPYSYLWDEEGTDATLVDPIGANRSIAVSADGSQQQRTWRVSATNECKLCHNAGSAFVLGFVPNQLSSQLASLNAQRVVSPLVTVPASATLVNPHDAKQKLDDRARSYLHANCAMCHHPGGNAIVSFYLKRDLPFDQLRTNKGTGIGTFGMRNAKLIVPGDPYRSVLMYRMSKLGYARMPYIGSQVVDSTGMALVSEWIRSLSDVSSGESSGPIVKGSPEAEALAKLTGGDVTARGERDAAIKQLVQTTEGSLALLAKMHGGTMSSDDTAAAVAIGNAVPNNNVRGLFETFLAESQRRARLGPNIDAEVILSREGNAARGKLIFFSDGARCKACHDIRDRDKSLGSTLLDINRKYKSRPEILQHVLKPSLKIDEPLAAYIVIMTNGRSVTGLIVDKTDDVIAIKTAEGKIVRISTAEIETMRRSSKSLMPDQILSDLTAQEAADLLEYIGSVGSGE